MANWRALKQVLQHGDPRRVAWDKTTHDFPSVSGENRALRPLGQILLENHVITEAQLEQALTNRIQGLRLGGSMLMQGLITAQQLAQALAEQNGVGWESVDAWQIPRYLIEQIPASVALHYAVLPLRIEDDVLVVGSEDGIDPVSLAALSRKTGRRVRYVIVLRGGGHGVTPLVRTPSWTRCPRTARAGGAASLVNATTTNRDLATVCTASVSVC